MKSIFKKTFTNIRKNNLNQLTFPMNLLMRDFNNGILFNTLRRNFGEKKDSGFPQFLNFTYICDQSFKENRLIIYTRKLNLNKNGMILLYKSEIEKQNSYKSLLFKNDILAILTLILTSGIILNYKLFLLFFIPFYCKFNKQINFENIRGLLCILLLYRVITEINIDRNLNKLFIKTKENQIITQKTTDICLLSKDQSRIFFNEYDDSNSKIYRLFAYEFLPIRINKEYNYLLPIDGRIYDKELLGHVLRGRAIVTPANHEVACVSVASKSEDLSRDVYITRELQEYEKNTNKI